jgi:hypothetical protein
MNKGLQRLRSMVKDPVIILGGGPSLEDEPLHLLNGKCVIGTNVAMFKPFVKIGIAGDWDFYRKRKYDIQSLHIPFVTLDNGVKKDFLEAIYFEKRNHFGMVQDGKGLAWFMPGNSNGGNTGAAALNLAIVMGAMKIILVGFDMKKRDDKEHFHDEYVKDVTRIPGYLPYKDFIARFASFVPFLTSIGIKVYNTCLDSGMDCFEKKPLKELI